MIETRTEQEGKVVKAVEMAKNAEFTGETDEYAIKVNRFIRERYSLSDEIALIRKALAKLNINDAQLDEYNEFVERCKEKAKTDLLRED